MRLNFELSNELSVNSLNLSYAKCAVKGESQIKSLIISDDIILVTSLKEFLTDIIEIGQMNLIYFIRSSLISGDPHLVKQKNKIKHI